MKNKYSKPTIVVRIYKEKDKDPFNFSFFREGKDFKELGFYSGMGDVVTIGIKRQLFGNTSKNCLAKNKKIKQTKHEKILAKASKVSSEFIARKMLERNRKPCIVNRNYTYIGEGIVGYWECLKGKIKNPNGFIYKEYEYDKKCPAILGIKLKRKIWEK